VSRRARDAGAVGTLVLLAVLALGPVLWSRGYVIVGDMTFVPDQPWKPAWLGLDGSVPRAVPADAFVAVLGMIVPGDLLQKLVLLATLVLAGLGVFRLSARAPGLARLARLGGAVLYLWNPFVFERFAIGHWGLLVGYAVLPWVADAALGLRAADRVGAPRIGGRLVLLSAVAAVGSPTGGVLAGVVATVLLADRRQVGRSAAAAVAIVLVNLPWLAPATLNDLTTSDGSGVAAFAARSDTPFGTVASLLTFGGIWKSAVVPGERGAGVLAGAALVVVLLSVAAFVRGGRRSPVRDGLAPTRFLVLGLAALVTAGLPATGPGDRFVTSLVDAVPGAGLWRDSQKWLIPFVLVACLGFAFLLDAVARRMGRADAPAGAAVAVLALLPVVLLPSLAWGLSGRFVPAHYPAEWQTVRSLLEQRPAARTMAVLPWSAYQRLPWNGRRAALDPAIRYFPGQVLVSEDLVIDEDLTVHGENAAGARIGRAVADGQVLGPVLAAVGVRYLLVEKSAPSKVAVAVPSGVVLHDGPELKLLDLGTPGTPSTSPHRGLIIAADALAALVALCAALLVVRRNLPSLSGIMSRGSSTDGGHADYR
jgi:hypothetical protein